MAEVVVDEQSLAVLKEFYKSYEEELERESAERAKQDTIDSQQAEILVKEKIESEKKAEAIAEKEAIDKQELTDFRLSINESLAKLNEDPLDFKKKSLEHYVSFDEKLSFIEKMDEKIEMLTAVVVPKDEQQAQNYVDREAIGLYADISLIAIVFIVLVTLPAVLFGKLIKRLTSHLI